MNKNNHISKAITHAHVIKEISRHVKAPIPVIHNFSKDIKVPAVTQPKKVELPNKKHPICVFDAKAVQNEVPILDCPPVMPEPMEYCGIEQEETTEAPILTPILAPITQQTELPEVYKLGDVYEGRRIVMKHLGIDVGTKTVVVAFRGEDDKTKYISEINGWWPFERATTFIEKLLDDPNKVRSDGTKRPARWIKLEGNQIVVLGRDAEEFAYSKNDTLRRPMADGGISQDEESMTILASIVQGLIEMAEKDVGKFDDEVKISYCTTADAINKESSNVDYHERVVSMIIESYQTDAKVTLVGPYQDSPGAIKESHAIVLELSEQNDGDGTGIGISWGAGTVTVSYVKWGQEIYSFCWVGAGDWIDNEVAKRHGYDPHGGRVKRKSKETPTTVSRRKEAVDLTPGREPSDRIDLDIVFHYDVLINRVIDGIVDGFLDNESEARIDDTIPIYMAGGTCSPKGFTERVAAKFDEYDLPFEIGKIYKSEQPLYCVAAGCLRAAEMF